MSSRFEIKDRRGSNKIEPLAPAVAAVEEIPKVDGEWEDVAYLIVIAPGQNGNVMVVGRAVGLRNDGETFIGDWLFPPIWKESMQWQPEARKRLDTFKNCACGSGLLCSVHKLYLQQWRTADTQRMELIGSEPLPKAMEVLIKAEQARAAAKIAVPR